MKRMIALACLLAAPSTLFAQSATDMMTRDQIKAAGALLKAHGGLAAPLDLDLKTVCPDFYRENAKSEAGGSKMPIQDAINLVQACVDEIASRHVDMMCAPRVSLQTFGCSAWVPCTTGRTGITVWADFLYEDADSDASWAQAPLHNGLLKEFGGGILGYESDFQGNHCSH